MDGGKSKNDERAGWKKSTDWGNSKQKTISEFTELLST